MGYHSFNEAAEALKQAGAIKETEAGSEKYIDSHCHYEVKQFNKNREQIIEKVSKCCEKVICVGTNTAENAMIEKLCEKYGFIYGMTGYFPTYVYKLDEKLCKQAEENMAVMLKQLENPKCVGVGEIGLDYNWDSVGDLKDAEAREYQKKWFIQQAKIAIGHNKPVSIHSRDAEEDTVDIISKLGGLRGVVHCFSYSPKTARFLTDRGLYLGIGGTSTYKSNEMLRQTIKEAPMDRLLLETDAPYLSPEPVRRQMNDSSNIKYVIENIANIKNISYEEVVHITNENCKRLYGF